ncbi:hypothetical protein [Chromohalobacter sp. HP20-39]|uniref:hypothetical protein n=1 Tax=Chromohalobacter sp. HP20-39 TaxID=3079306 RepID=UPI00294B8AF5|nr:hypothetical protein [Chromohalobacter sp. HP20-39]MDV6317817.1 hypothetical protein [Chromohalobacter sp. HP20-39]
MRFKGLKEKMIESPSWRTVFSFLIPVLTGILSGAFVTEITINGVVTWSLFYKANSFYGLLVTSFCIYIYNKEVYLFEKQVSKFADTEYCTAYMRSKCLPEAAERYKQIIRSGNGGELKQAMDEINKVLK